MKNIDLLSKQCSPDPEPGTAKEPDVSKLSNDVIDRIAEAVIAKLSAGQGGSDPDPEPDTDPGTDPEEGGETDEHGESE